MQRQRALSIVGTRAKRIDDYQIQPMLPMGFPYLGIEFREAEFRQYESEPGIWYVEVSAIIGTLKNPYTIVLSIPQALDADIIERV